MYTYAILPNRREIDVQKEKPGRAGSYQLPFFMFFLKYVDISPHEVVTSINYDRIFHSIHIN